MEVISLLTYFKIDTQIHKTFMAHQKKKKNKIKIKTWKLQKFHNNRVIV